MSQMIVFIFNSFTRSLMMLLRGEITNTLALAFEDSFAVQDHTKHLVNKAFSKAGCQMARTSCPASRASAWLVFALVSMILFFGNRDKHFCNASAMASERLHDHGKAHVNDC